MFKKFLYLSFALVASWLDAQTPVAFSNDYHTFWGRWMAVHKTQKVDYIAEFILRQQENEFAPPYWAGHNKPLAAPLMRGIRLWAQVKAHPHLRIDLATSLFETYYSIRKPSDIHRPFFHDARITILPTYLYRKNRFDMMFRLGGEALWITPQTFDSVTFRTRLRARPFFRYKLMKGLSTSLSDEFFVSVLDTRKLRYDQHRPSWMFHYEPISGTLFESGLMFNHRPADPVRTLIWMAYWTQTF
jgi:hypothetical protein